MTGSAIVRCPRCGASRAPSAAWRDLCPGCLLATALSLDDEACPYRVLAPIAEGPRAITYLAQPFTRPRRYVALKIYAPRHDTDAILSRYRHWAPTLEAFHHHNFCRLLNVNLTAQGQLYVATEYVQGWPLTAIDGRPSVETETRIELAHQLVAAIEAAHAVDLMHLGLVASKVKFSTADKHTTILGLGSSLIVDGTDARAEADVVALVRLVRLLGIALPERQYESAAAVRAEMPTR
jgi:serine/threonine protein kinase